MADRNTRVPVATREAKEQAAEYFGFAAGVSIKLDNGKVFEIPNPSLLDDDQQERYEELQFLLEQCDREDDIVIPARTLADGEEVAERTIKGDLKQPYRIDGNLLKPNYNARIGIVAFGEEGYKEFKASGGSGAQIALEWARMNKEFADRAEADSKSEGGDGSVAAVPAGDPV